MKGLADLQVLDDVRSLLGTGRGCIPRTHRSAYLELYVLQQAKARLEKEAALLSRRGQTIAKRLAELQKRLDHLTRWASSGTHANGPNSPPRPRGAERRRWKTLALHY